MLSAKEKRNHGEMMLHIRAQVLLAVDQVKEWRGPLCKPLPPPALPEVRSTTQLPNSPQIAVNCKCPALCNRPSPPSLWDKEPLIKIHLPSHNRNLLHLQEQSMAQFVAFSTSSVTKGGRYSKDHPCCLATTASATHVCIRMVQLVARSSRDIRFHGPVRDQ